MSANNMQVGGAHYQSTLQHWDYAAANFGPGYFKGNATKYLARWRKKNGLEDLQKARHYVQKMCEVDWDKLGFSLATPVQVHTDDFRLANGTPVRDAALMHRITAAAGRRDLETALNDLDDLIKDATEANTKSAPAARAYHEQG